MAYYLGVDSSTTATKALLMDPTGTVVGIGRSEYGFETPRPLWAEQSPEVWWTATKQAVAEVLQRADISGAEVHAIGLTGQMHGLVLVDAAGDVLRPAILWNDQRTQAECDEIRDRVGDRRLIELTGNDALTGFTAPKLLWVRNHEPEIYGRTAHVLLPKDYVRFRLTGDYAVDKAGGSGTLLFDLAGRDWAPEMLDALEIPAAWLPPSFEGPEVTGRVTAAAAAATGLRPGTPVVAGAGDQAASAVGVGAVAPGIVALSIGTSGVVFAPTARPRFEPAGRLHAFCHALPGRWHVMGVMLSAAGSYRWLREAVAPDQSYADLDEAAREVPPGAGGLVFLPYLSGERTPHPDPAARGAFVGLTVRHGLGHLARAVMEGVGYGLRDVFRLVSSQVEVSEVRVSGGGTSSTTWLEIIAGILGRPVLVAAYRESAARGAAMLAATGDGRFRSVPEAVDACVHLDTEIEPRHRDRYEMLHEVYAGLYPQLRDTFARLTESDAGG